MSQGLRHHAAEEYQRRQQDREAQGARLELTHRRIGAARLAIVAGALAAVWGIYGAGLFSARWLLLPLVVFLVVVLIHSRVGRARDLAWRAAAFYQRGLMRIEDQWIGQGDAGARFADPHHIYSADLDLFGSGSLFELLCVSRTRMGQNTVAQWLLSPATLEVIRARQAAILELRERLDLRESIALLGDDDSVVGQPHALSEWSRTHSRLPHRWLLSAAITLPAAIIISMLVWWRTGLLIPLVIVIGVEAAIIRYLRQPLRKVISDVEAAAEGLGVVTTLIARLEREPLASARLVELQQLLVSKQNTASQLIRKLTNIAHLLESRRNPILQVLDVPLMYSVQAALAAERWQHAHGRSVDVWLEVMGEFEALISIATYSYEHPDDLFPQFVDGAALFVADSLGHPLLPAARCVRNDVRIVQPARVLLISGSNMSGKSTLLRSVGINTVLAMMGAPVRARRISLTPLQVGASIRINDSLHEGSSRFYAEITRLRQLLEIGARQPPLLFLLDEVLQGTNSMDRRIGAEGVLRAYFAHGAIGLVSTHDLALTDIDHTNRLCNLHFQDELRDGRMTFDYRLREGVVEKSNGIELMRSIGLDV